jgi:uncharacterized protein with PQ loop repeat
LREGQGMKTVFMMMYPMVGLISLFAFIPQIISLIKAVTPPVNVSIRSWLLWTIGAFISLGYGYFYLEDLMYIVTCGMNFALDLLVVLLLIHRRFVIFGQCANLYHALTEYFLKYPFLAVPAAIPVTEKIEN